MVLLIASGIGYRAIATRYAGVPSAAPLARGTLERLPMAFGDWQGHSVPLGERIVEATDTDDHINRAYLRGSTATRVQLFVAYGVRMRDLMPHRPEVCYPGAGWTLEDHRQLAVEINTADLPVQVHTFSRGGLSTNRVVVLSYYVIDDVFLADVSELRSRAWRFDNKTGSICQVQVMALCTHESALAAAHGDVQAFAGLSAEAIRELLRQETSSMNNADKGGPK